MNPVQSLMKLNFVKRMVWLAGAAAVGWLIAARAQQNGSYAASPGATNWVGYLVYGSEDTVDAISHGGPYPTADRQLELGLRNDGTVVWRRAHR